MMNNRDRLKKKYKHKITPGEKSVEELIEHLKHKVDIVEIATTELRKSILQHIIYNVINCIRNQQNLSADELNILAYKLIKNGKSNSYYQCNYAHISDDEEDDIIYVVIETKTGAIHSNSSKLLLELFVEQGISQYDYDNETLIFDAYLGYLDWYSNEEY